MCRDIRSHPQTLTSCHSNCRSPISLRSSSECDSTTELFLGLLEAESSMTALDASFLVLQLTHQSGASYQPRYVLRPIHGELRQPAFQVLPPPPDQTMGPTTVEKASKTARKPARGGRQPRFRKRSVTFMPRETDLAGERHCERGACRLFSMKHGRFRQTTHRCD